MKNVLILVIVHKMLTALQGITGEYVIVYLTIQAIHMALLVHQVRAFLFTFLVAKFAFLIM